MKIEKLVRLKPSELIEVALADAEAAMESGHMINLSDWYSHKNHDEDSKHCMMCLAGAVMRGCYGEKVLNKKLYGTFSVVPYDFFDPDEWNNVDVFAALDSFRKGNILQGYWDLKRIRPKEIIMNFTIRNRAGDFDTIHDRHWKEFKEDMMMMVEYLKGLDE